MEKFLFLLRALDVMVKRYVSYHPLHGLGLRFKGSLSPLKNENKLDEDFYCTLHKFVLIRFIQRNQGHRDSVMHEFHSNVNKVNKAVAKVRTIGDRLPLI